MIGPALGHAFGGWFETPYPQGFDWAVRISWLGGTPQVSVPLLFISLFCSIPWLVWWRRQRSKPGTACDRCGYDLRGCHSERCPECGVRFRNYRAELTTIVEKLRRRELTVEEFDELFYELYVERDARDSLAPRDRVFFDSCHRTLGRCMPGYVADDSAGSMTEPEYVEFVEELSARFSDRRCLGCGGAVADPASRYCAQCGAGEKTG